jgi:hypothetical protein
MKKAGPAQPYTSALLFEERRCDTQPSAGEQMRDDHQQNGMRTTGTPGGVT